MKKFNAYNAINGTSALKIEEQGREVRSGSNVVRFPSERINRSVAQEIYEETSYLEFAKDELDSFSSLFRQEKTRSSRQAECSVLQGLAIGALFAAFALFVVLI